MNDHQEFQQSFDRSDKGEFRLPKIERYSSRGGSKQIKNNIKLPTLKSDTQLQSSQGTERKSAEDENFGGQAQKRLRFIMKQRNIMQIAESEESDGDTFQKKIKENKEIIKQARKRNQKSKKQNLQQNKITKKMSQKLKFQGNQKRCRQPKQISLENKHMKKKKQLVYSTLNKNVLREIKQSQKDIPKISIALKQINNSNIREFKEVKSKDELACVHKIMPNQIRSNRQQFSAENRKIKKEFSQKVLTAPLKNYELFQAIQNYLQNPKKPEIQVDNHKVLKERLELQQKLKEYELKLNKNTIQTQSRPNMNSRFDNDQLQQQANPKLIQSNRWRKIGVSDSRLINELSSFDREMDRIGQYLHRNQKSIERYIQNQKHLIDVQISKRQGQRERYKSCETQNSI